MNGVAIFVIVITVVIVFVHVVAGGGGVCCNIIHDSQRCNQQKQVVNLRRNGNDGTLFCGETQFLPYPYYCDDDTEATQGHINNIAHIGEGCGR